MANNKAIGKRLFELRRQYAMTLENVAGWVNTTKQTVYKYEQGEIKNIPLEKIETLAKFYRVSPAYIVGCEEQKDA